MFGIITTIILAYLLGSVSGSMLVGAWHKVDIRLSGSGNAGGTNAFRTQGIRFALGVVVIDIGKGLIAAWLLPNLQLGGTGAMLTLPTLAASCGIAAIAGHCYPVWHGFRGGKGAATSVGVLCVIQPLALIPMIGTWLVVLGLSGWVGLATMLAGISLVPAMWWLHAPTAHLWFAIILASFMLFTHRGNIRNMFQGAEYRFEKAMIRNWFH
jgi:glycerol-3-phosphate acyltransferase PlsY